MNRKGFNYVTFLFGLIVLIFVLFLLYKYTGLFNEPAKEHLSSCATPISKCACQLTGTETCPSQAVRSYRTQDCPLNCAQGDDVSSVTPIEDKDQYGLCCVAAINQPWEEKDQ